MAVLPAGSPRGLMPHGPSVFTTDHDHRKWAFWGLRSKCIWSAQKADGWHTWAFKQAVSLSDSLLEVSVAE